MLCIRALEQEWQTLSPRIPTELHRWLDRQPEADRELVSRGCLGDVLACVAADPDRVLWLLLRAERDGVAYAGRVVLQAMLPKVYAMARRDAYACPHDYVVHLWLRIRTFPLRRRRRVAANLALDTLKAVKSEQRNRFEVADGRLERQLRQRVPDPVPDADGVLRAATELGVIDSATAAVLTSVYADGLSGCEAAVRHSLSPALVRRRCHVGVRRLAAAREELMDAVA